MKKTLRLILGDQLNINHSWFQEKNDATTYVLMEIRSETDYVQHHVQKIAGIFAAMRNFASELTAKNHHVLYIKINDENNLHSFEKNIKQLIELYQFSYFEYQLPDEYRVDQHVQELCKTISIPSKAYDTEHFFSERNELATFFNGKKTYIMENFYRMMRKKHHVLMEGDKPLTGKWNYDQDNRKKLPKNHVPVQPYIFNNNVSEIVTEIKKAGITFIGEIDEKNLLWPINRDQTLKLLHFFTSESLNYFGDYQDAMAPNFWSMYHSRLSFALNIKLISPLEVINAAVEAWNANPEKISYNQLEGFVRQILGWREFMRGVYWAKMPEFAHLNYFKYTNKLPHWFWTGKTKMNCVRDAIEQSLHYAYAHHIQRLMITGNFLILAETDPDEVDQWYLGIYIDAFEWVELTNTRGMSQFADGGIVGTKPYVSSSTYIHKMSSYCSTCFYKKEVKTGEKACPFNSLYWNFYNRNENLLRTNPRIAMMYKVWDKMKSEEKTALLHQAAYYLKKVNEL